MTSMNCVRILRWQHLIIGSLTLRSLKFNAYFGCIYCTERDQFVSYVNTSINEVLGRTCGTYYFPSNRLTL